jgi:hypothetical protein
VFCTILQQLNPLYDSNHARWQDLVKFLFGWAHNRRPTQERTHWQSLAEQHIQEEERKREIESMSKTIAQSIFEEGHDSGMRTSAHRILFRLGRKQLGEPDEATIRALEAMNDLDRLERMIDAVAELKSWQDVLAIS